MQILSWKKVSGLQQDSKPMASAVVLQGTTKWAMKTHMLVADQFIEFIFTHDRNEMQNEVDLNCRKNCFWTKICNCLNCHYNCDDHIFRPSVFLQFKSTSFHVQWLCQEIILVRTIWFLSYWQFTAVFNWVPKVIHNSLIICFYSYTLRVIINIYYMASSLSRQLRYR